MIKLLNVDTSGRVPCPTAQNLNLARLRGLKTLGGTKLEGEFPALEIQLKDGDESPSGLVDYFQVGLLNVVSAKLRKILEGIGVEVEYLPVIILYHGKPTAFDYFVANPLKRFEAIDMDSSQVELDEGLDDALAVNRLVIDQSKFKDVKLAVVAEIQKIGVQNEVALAVELSDCVGCVFLDPISLRY